MRWRPPEEREVEEGEAPRKYDRPIDYPREIGASDTTAFMRMQTEIEKKEDLVDKDFIKRHKSRILACDKFAPLANIRNLRQIQIQRMRNLKIDLEEEAGLYDDAEKTALDSISDFQISRGISGFYQQAMITQRHEIKEEGKEEKAKRLGGLFKRKEPETEGER